MDYIWHAELLNFLATGDYPEGLSRDEKRNYRRKAKSFETKGDKTLFYIQGKARLEVILEGQTEAIMKELHGGTVGGGHFGQNITIRKVTERYWWKGASNDVRDFCRKCAVCQLSNPLNRPDVEQLHPLPASGII